MVFYWEEGGGKIILFLFNHSTHFFNVYHDKQFFFKTIFAVILFYFPFASIKLLQSLMNINIVCWGPEANSGRTFAYNSDFES